MPFQQKWNVTKLWHFNAAWATDVTRALVQSDVTLNLARFLDLVSAVGTEAYKSNCAIFRNLIRFHSKNSPLCWFSWDRLVRINEICQ